MNVPSLIVALFGIGNPVQTPNSQHTPLREFVSICILMPIGTAITTTTEMGRIYQESLELSTHKLIARKVAELWILYQFLSLSLCFSFFSTLPILYLLI